jgi:hypothetical protein
VALLLLPLQAEYKAEYRLSLVLGPHRPPGDKRARCGLTLVKERTAGPHQHQALSRAFRLIQGDQTREFSALRQGVIDMAVGSTINWSPQVKDS